MIKVWGWIGSSNVQKVLWCCGELALDHELHDKGWPYAGYKERPYLDLNPNGLVPTIEDGTFVLWESNSILRYLAEKYGEGRLLPTTSEERADTNRWMDWQLTTMGPAMTPVYRALIRTPADRQDPAFIQTSRARAEERWKILDSFLENRSFVAGHRFSIGDIPLGILAYRWFNLPIEPSGLGHLRAWYERLCERPAYRKQIMKPLI